MIKIENVEIWGWKHAIRGMRNPMNSWDKSDSHWHEGGCEKCPHEFVPCNDHFNESGVCYKVGPNDLDLMKRLSKAGPPHRKFLRQIFVSLDITAPLYWWKEFDTYKVGTTANSCSTMHKIQAKEFVQNDFSHEHLSEASLLLLDELIDHLNACRSIFNATQDKEYWWQMIQLLPSSYNQRRTVTLTYENLLSMLEYRRNHKQDEWREFCKWILTLPYHEVLEIGVCHE